MHNWWSLVPSLLYDLESSFDLESFQGYSELYTSVKRHTNSSKGLTTAFAAKI